MVQPPVPSLAQSASSGAGPSESSNFNSFGNVSFGNGSGGGGSNSLLYVGLAGMALAALYLWKR